MLAMLPSLLQSSLRRLQMPRPAKWERHLALPVHSPWGTVLCRRAGSQHGSDEGLDVCGTNRRTYGVLFILTHGTSSRLHNCLAEAVPCNDVTFLLLFCGETKKREEKKRSRAICSFDADSNRWQTELCICASSLFFRQIL